MQFVLLLLFKVHRSLCWYMQIIVEQQLAVLLDCHCPSLPAPGEIEFITWSIY